MVSLYLHIPFCQRKCAYCDFYSIEDAERVEGFLVGLAREIERSREEHGDDDVATIYLGGGTPSLLSAEQIERVLGALRQHWRVRQDAEITLEANPGTIAFEKLSLLRDLGINRVSLGVQSFHDPLLRFLGRIHSSADALRAVESARAAGFVNLGLDLIYGIPGEELGQWEDDLRTALKLGPMHLSAYNLTVARHTPLGQLVDAGAVRPAAAEHEAAMFERTAEWTSEAGFEHYEVSNYARDGFRSQHNGAYWSHRDYFGLGPSAHSFRKDPDGRGARRWRNVSDIGMYQDRLARDLSPTEFEERLGVPELARERVFLGLRATGLDLARLRVDYGYSLEEDQRAFLEWMREEGLGVFEGSFVRLTTKGYLLCDEICARLSRNMIHLS